MKKKTLIIKDCVEPMKTYFKENRGKDIDENKLCKKFKLTPSQVRYCIAELRYIMPITNFGGRLYQYPSDPALIKKYIEKLQNQVKEKIVKKRVAMQFIKNE